MEKNEMISMVAVTVAGIISIILIFLTRWEVYQDAMDNWLFLLLIWIAMLAIGYGISRLFVSGEKGGRKREKIFDND